MGDWQTTSTHDTGLPAEKIWNGAYADPDAWPLWNREIASARASRPLALGVQAKIRFKNRARMTFTVIEYQSGSLFTDETRLPLARMGHRHLLEPLPAGGTRLVNTIYVRGPLSWLWARVLGRKAAAALGEGQQTIERLISAGEHPQ
jgi:Polyketide cyclase / dehydrase and lipid transport